MKYYIDSICRYIGKQVYAMEQSGARRLVLMIPSLTAGLTQKLAQSLEYQCGKNKVVLNFKVARELYSQWSESERSILKDYEAQGSLTELRNRPCHCTRSGKFGRLSSDYGRPNLAGRNAEKLSGMAEYFFSSEWRTGRYRARSF